MTDASLAVQGVDGFLSQLIERILDIILMPKENPEALWLLFPLILTILLMELYFGRYTKEELGWNTAYGNSLVLIFIAIFLFKYIHESNLWIDATKMAVMAVLIFVGLALIVTDFWHLIPKKIAFAMSSKLPTNYLAYIAITLIYSDIPINYLTLIAFAVIFIIFAMFVWFIREIAPKITRSIHPSTVPSPSTEQPEYKETT